MSCSVICGPTGIVLSPVLTVPTVDRDPDRGGGGSLSSRQTTAAGQETGGTWVGAKHAEEGAGRTSWHTVAHYAPNPAVDNGSGD